MTQWTVRLLGDIDVRVDGVPVDGLRGTRAGFLLGYLVTERARLHDRGVLAAMLWPGRPQSSARANLRQMVLHLRRRLEGDDADRRLVVTRSGIGFRAGAHDEIDLDGLDAPACCGEPGVDPACRRTRTRLAEAVHRYRGPLLGSGMEAVVEYEAQAWLLRRREELRGAARAALSRLGQCFMAVGAPDEAIGEIRRYLDCEPFDEPGQRLLMQALGDAGRASAAVEHFDAFAGELEYHFDRDPATETRRLRDRLAQQPADEAVPAGLPVERREIIVVAIELASDPQTSPEPAADAVSAARRCAREQLVAQRGHVIEAHGGLLLAYFGYPTPLERGAARAARAAVQAVEVANESARAGAAVHAEPILTGTDPELPDPAGSLSAAAVSMLERIGASEVQVSAAIRERVDFDYPAEPVAVPRSAPTAYRIRPERRTRPREGPSAPPLFGRGEEHAALLDQWARTGDEAPITVTLIGPAGSGKTRLATALAREVGNDGGRILTLRALPHASGRAFGAAIDSLEEWLALAGVHADTGADHRARTLAAWLDPGIGDPEHTLSRLAQLVALPGVTLPDPEPDPERARGRIMDALDHLVSSLTNGPRLLLLEDIHWFDPALLGWVRRLPERLVGRPPMVLTTGRPESPDPWPHTCHARLEIGPLEPDAAAALLDHHAPASGFEDDMRHRILALSSGLPLFLEAFGRAAAEDHPLPATLHELLLSRLERLGRARQVAEVAAVLGEPFTLKELERVAGADPGADTDVAGALEQLVATDFLEATDEPVDGHYRWRHAVYREAAYAALPPARARALHGRAADALLEDDRAQPAIVAYQLEQADRPAEAAAWRLRAGERALVAGATGQAADHFERALVQAGDADDASLALEARIGLGTAYLGLHGYGSRAVEESFRAATMLPGVEQDPQRHGRVLWGLWMCASSFHGFVEAWRLARELQQLAETADDPLMVVAARCALAINALFTGLPADAVEHARAARCVDPATRHIELAARFGDNPGVTARAIEGWAQWFAGAPDAAWRALDTACEEAEAIGHVPTCGFVHTVAAAVAQRADDADRAARAAAMVHEHVGAAGHPLWASAAHAYAAWAEVRRGNPAAVERIVDVVARVDEVMDGSATVFRLVLADGQARSDRLEAARVTLEQALEHVDRVGDEGFRPDIHLQQAHLEWRCGDTHAARDELEKAAAFAALNGNRLVEFEVVAIRAALPDADSAETAAFVALRERWGQRIPSPHVSSLRR